MCDRLFPSEADLRLHMCVEEDGEKLIGNYHNIQVPIDTAPGDHKIKELLTRESTSVYLDVLNVLFLMLIQTIIY